MGGHERLIPLILAMILGLLAWLLQRSIARSERKIDIIDAKVEKQGETLTEIRLGVTQCVTWDELGRELGPIKTELKQQDHRLTIMETHCKAKENKG